MLRVLLPAGLAVMLTSACGTPADTLPSFADGRPLIDAAEPLLHGERVFGPDVRAIANVGTALLAAQRVAGGSNPTGPHLLWRIFKNGTTPPVPIGRVERGPEHLLEDGGFVYVRAWSGEIERLPAEGGAPTPIVPVEASTFTFGLIGGALVWAAPDGVHRTPVTGGAAEVVDAEPPRTMARGTVGALAWQRADGVIRLLDAAGPHDLATEPGVVAALAFDATHVVWLADGELRRVPIAGGVVEVVATDVVADVLRPALGGVYVVTPPAPRTPELFFAPAPGTPPARVGPLDAIAPSVLVDGDDLYWIEAATGTVVRLPPG